MRNLIKSINLFVNKFLQSSGTKKVDSRQISVHYRRDLDSLGEYIKFN